MYVWIVLKANK